MLLTTSVSCCTTHKIYVKMVVVVMMLVGIYPSNSAPPRTPPTH